MLRRIGILGIAAALAGCVAVPDGGYGYSQPYYTNGYADSYGYGGGGYAPVYGTVNIWGGGGGYRDHG
ncbi:lipoprotein, partial [Burkholderia glumae]